MDGEEKCTTVVDEMAVNELEEENALESISKESAMPELEPTEPITVPDAECPPSEAPIVCAKCGALLEDTDVFCPRCGSPRIEKRKCCSKCGTELKEDQDFCPKCGTKYAEKKTKVKVPKIFVKRIILISAIAVLVAVGIVLGVLIAKQSKVEEVFISQSLITLEEGGSSLLSFTIKPDTASKKAEIEWVSSNVNVATVSNNGMVYAQTKGNCVITVMVNGTHTASCTVNVEESAPDLQDIYNRFCNYSFASVASDGSYLKLDTNPNNRDDYIDYSAYSALSSVNEALGLPDSLLQKMNETRALDGRQTATYGNITVSWGYHPDQGLEIIYEIVK